MTRDAGDSNVIDRSIGAGQREAIRDFCGQLTLGARHSVVRAVSHIR
jgi:hypothetical protein